MMLVSLIHRLGVSAFGSSLFGVLVSSSCRTSEKPVEPVPARRLAMMSDADVLCSIAADIERMAPRYPQLAEFRPPSTAIDGGW